jgi:hypothetical protein
VIAKCFGLTDCSKLTKEQLQRKISRSPMKCACKKDAKKTSKKTPKKRSPSKKTPPKKRKKSSPLKRSCQGDVSRKIAINMKEERYMNPQQAIAVAYAQVRKARPECKRYTIKKNKKEVRTF